MTDCEKEKERGDDLWNALADLLGEISEPTYWSENIALRYEQRQVTKGAIDEARAILEKHRTRPQKPISGGPGGFLTES